MLLRVLRAKQELHKTIEAYLSAIDGSPGLGGRETTSRARTEFARLDKELRQAVADKKDADEIIPIVSQVEIREIREFQKCLQELITTIGLFA